MSQNIVDFSDDPSGDQLLDDKLTPLQENFLTRNSGTSRPSYAVAGTEWLDTTTVPWLEKTFDGTDDIITGYINPTTNTYTPAGAQLNNFSASTAPTINDDSGDGYSVGSRWINTTSDEEYVCVDSTGGAAVWKNTTPAGILNNFSATSNPTINDDSGDGYSVGSRWINLTTDNEYVLLDSSSGAAVWKNTTPTLGSLASLSSVANSNMANMAARTVKVNATNSAAQPTDFALTSKQFLICNDAGNALIAGSFGSGLTVTGGVVTSSGSGTVTSVTAGDGLSGGSITTSGTVSVNTNNSEGVGAYNLIYNSSGGTIADGATIAGSSISRGYGTTSNAWGTSGGNPAGTWRNVSGRSLAPNEHGLFIRSA